MFFHVIMTTGCDGKCCYCYQKSPEDMEEDHGFDIDHELPRNT